MDSLPNLWQKSYGDAMENLSEEDAVFGTWFKSFYPKAQAAIATLDRLGYIYYGGVLWKPPLGNKHKEKINEVRNSI